MTSLLLALATFFAGLRPTTTAADEVTRVRAHLVAARAFVRAHDIRGLTAAQRQRRLDALANLDRYIERGEFPLRTDDSYEGRRPRFIDARGVHCAVGYLIATSGHPELARELDGAFEYAFVRDIDSPALLAWSTEHGFTIDELARIQPSYSAPPTADGIEYQIEREKDRYMLACADASTHAKVTLVAKGDDDGRVQVVAKDGSDRFAKCVADLASQLEHGGGAFSPSPSPFERTLVLTLKTPNTILAERMRDKIGMPNDCTPRPGAIPTHATVEIGTEAGQLAIHATTTPVNAQVGACIEAYLSQRLRDFASIPDLAWKQRVKLKRMESRAVHDALLRYAPGFATDCYDVETAPKQVAIRVAAATDDKAFAITTDAPGKPFERCVLEKLQPRLRKAFTVNGYFRIDNAIETSLTFAVETPAARDVRLTKARAAEKKHLPPRTTRS